MANGRCATRRDVLTLSTSIGSRPYATMATDLKSYKLNHLMCEGDLYGFDSADMLISIQDSG
jgi:hypothetical protein